MNITLVLDASAVGAYARMTTVSVGELIQVIAEDGDLVGIPACELADVWPDLTKEERQLVTALIDREDSPVEVLPLHGDLVPDVAAQLRRIGFGAAHTVAAVQQLGATVATRTPRAYADLLDPDDVLPLS
ncbi:hypothetical protein [Catellatospora methionotrophica]|uniref:hypothetical protein n=1 Tax=Catellatospora methionotrophica TaxID=121620 RepID=UPI0033F1E56E